MISGLASANRSLAKHTLRFIAMVKFSTSDTKLNHGTGQSEKRPNCHNEPAIPAKNYD